jgi:hypothetical protein
LKPNFYFDKANELDFETVDGKVEEVERVLVELKKEGL